MIRWRNWAGVLVVVMAIAPLSAQQRIADGELQAVFSRWSAEHRLVGIAVGRLDGSMASKVVAGVRRINGAAKIEITTDFEVGSITKAFTGTLLADMVLRHEVALDDPVAKYLPDWKVPSLAGQSITLIDLATHTSGLPSLPDNFRPTDTEDPYVDYTQAQLVDFLRAHVLRRAPGAQYEYSNLGMTLLGLALAKRSGMSYEALLRQRILDPLGMRDTHLSLTTNQLALAAGGHTDGLTSTKAWHLGIFGPAGGLHSTIPDLLKFAAALRDTTSGPLAKAMALAIRPRRPYRGADSVGLAWHHLRLNGADIVWHNGGTGGFRSWLGADIAKRKAVVVLANAGGEFPGDVIGIGLLRGGALVPPPAIEVTPEVTLSAEALDPLIGSYQLSPQFAFEITRDGNQLYAQATGQQRLPVYPGSAKRFFYKVVKAELVFQVDATGKVTGLVLRQNGIDQTARKVR